MNEDWFYKKEWLERNTASRKIVWDKRSTERSLKGTGKITITNEKTLAINLE
jgi:uncharacterized protein YdeI (YjbR/CyaY-like superfamily)